MDAPAGDYTQGEVADYMYNQVHLNEEIDDQYGTLAGLFNGQSECLLLKAEMLQVR